MTVKELIEALSKEDPNRIVVMSSDGEGNGHSPLSSYFCGVYVPDSTWSGEVYDDPADLDEEEALHEMVDGKGLPCLCFQPVN